GGLNLAQAQNGIRHTIPISTNFKILKHFTLTPSVNLNETWYFTRKDYTWNNDSARVEIDTARGAFRFGSINTSAQLSTNIYGMYSFTRRKTEAKRHVLTPTVGISYSPITSNKMQTYQSDTLNNLLTQSGYKQSIFGGPLNPQARRINFD